MLSGAEDLFLDVVARAELFEEGFAELVAVRSVEDRSPVSKRAPKLVDERFEQLVDLPLVGVRFSGAFSSRMLDRMVERSPR